MVGNVEGRDCPPREKLLCHGWVVDLMHYNVKHMDLCKSIHFELTTPTGVLPDPINIVVNAFVVLNEKLVQLLVFLYVLCALQPQLAMVHLIPF